MAHTVEEIAEILNEMRIKNNLNTESLENALSEINLKLAVITDDENIDMVKIYLAELKNLMFEKFNSSSVKMDSIENLFSKINTSEDLTDIKTQLKQIADELSFQISSIPLNISFNEFEQKIDDCKELTDNLRDEFHQNATVSIENFKKLANAIGEISTYIENSQDGLNKNIFSNYEYIKSIIEKIQTAVDELSTSVSDIKSKSENDEVNIRFEKFERSFDIIKELISQIQINDEIKILTKNVDNNFENIANRIGNIQSAFEKKSKTNYENLINEISSLKTDIITNIENKDNGIDYGIVTSSLDELSGNVEILRDISLKKHAETIENISQELQRLSTNAVQKINSDNEFNFGEIKTTLNNIIPEFEAIKSEFLKINDSTVYNISVGFNNVNTIFENIFARINSLGENFDNASKQNAQNILGKINDLQLNLEELKDEFNNSVYLDKIDNSINAISAKIDELSEKDNYKDDLDKIKDALAIIKTEADIAREEYSRELQENNSIHSEQFKIVSENVDSIKSNINDLGLSLKEYLTQIEQARRENNSETDEKTTQKLLDLKAELSQNSQEFENKFENLQAKLLEFVHIVEGSNSDTEGKILSSLEEVIGIKDELLEIHNTVKNMNFSQDEKFKETISLLDAGIENIVFNINNINDSVKNGIEISIKENILSLENKFIEITEILNSLKSKISDTDNGFLNDISNKINSLKEEISLVNTDITDAIQCKADDIIRNFEPLKIGLDNIIDYDIENLLQSFKSELELSFLNFTADFNKELEVSTEEFSNIKQTYKEILNKVSVVEDVVNKTLQNNIELLGVSFETGLRSLNSSLDEKLDNQSDALKAYFEVANNNTEMFELINTLKDQLVKVVENIKNQQQIYTSKNEELSANISLLSENLKTESKNIIENCSNDDVKSIVQELKLDNTDIKGGLEIVDNKIEKLSTTSDLLSLLNSKLDILASDDLNENLLDEIDEIKNIIFEQHKNIEESSDERAKAIDKYLRDVLLKLENVDIEKSSEDIKEAVLNAVLSLSDQISFVEETEEIKDFVEEKTDVINQNIIEVHKQLKQLTNGDDDFEYTYTLQDVESDIAKLRLAMNNISTGKFEDISDEIKRIVMSVENLESNLTQDEIVDLKTDIEKLNDDILSISSRTNKILLNSDESYKAVNDGLNNFSDLILKLEDRINYLDNTATTERIEKKIDNIQSISISSLNSNKVINQAMVYLGEWVDNTTQDISSLSDNVKKIKTLLPDNNLLISELQKNFEKQEIRIDNLERKLDKIVSLLEEKDDMVLNRKIDKFEKILSELSANVEKLTSYVE